MSFKLFIRSTTELQEVTNVPNSFDINGFQAVLDNVQRLTLIPLIGEPLFTSLLNRINSGDDSDALANTLISRIRFAVANEALHQYIPLLDVGITSGGITVTNSDHAAPASQWRVQSAQDQMRKFASTGFDQMLAYLEENRTHFTDWSGEVKDAAADLLINTTDEWNQVQFPPLGWYALWRLRPVMKRVEQQHIRPAMCPAFFDSIKTRIKNRGDVSAYSELLPLARRATADLTMAAAIEFIGLRVSDSGVYFESVQAKAQNIKQRNNLADDQLLRRANRYKESGEKWLEQMADHLQTSGSAYTDYTNCIGPPPETPESSAPTNGIFLM